MAWSRGLFRIWIILTVVYCILAVLIGWRGIVDPYISWGAFQLGDSEPVYLEYYGERFLAARELKDRNVLVEYTLTLDGMRWRETTFFVPSATPEAQRIQSIKAYIPKAKAIQNALIRRARYEAIYSLLAILAVPPFVLLALGQAIRWALRGFRQTPPRQ